MHTKVVTVFGGSGFIGRYVVAKLAKQGFTVRVAVKNTLDAAFLKPLGDVGQITPIPCNILNRKSIEEALDGANMAINLVGILYERGKATFTKYHRDAPQMIAEAAAQKKLERLIHISALGADKAVKSHYAKSKLSGEEAVKQAFKNATIIRPSIVFGAEDKFFNKFAGIARYIPILPVFGGGKTSFQPVYVDDVAEATLQCLLRNDTKGKTYEVGGPEVYTFKELLLKIEAVLQKPITIMNFPFFVGKIIALLSAFSPFEPIITSDQLRLLKYNNVVSKKALGLQDLGITPAALDAILPTYLYRFREGGAFFKGEVRE